MCLFPSIVTLTVTAVQERAQRLSTWASSAGGHGCGRDGWTKFQEFSAATKNAGDLAAKSTEEVRDPLGSCLECSLVKRAPLLWHDVAFLEVLRIHRTSGNRPQVCDAAEGLAADPLRNRKLSSRQQARRALHE